MGGSFNHWKQIADNIKPATRQIVTNTTLSIGDDVQANAPVASGFMRDSVYTVTPDGTSTYGQAGSPPGDASLLPEVQPDDDTSGIVGVAASYAGFVNWGTRFQAAQPFFDQAVETGRATLDAECSQFEGLIGKIS